MESRVPVIGRGWLVPKPVCEGSRKARTNFQPYLIVNFIIALQGIFPPRN